MRHRRAGYKLNRNATHRRALYRNLALALFRHERIITTVEKAKAVRPFVEKLITLARRASLEPEKALHVRRLVLARLGTPSKAEVRPPNDEKDDAGDPTMVITKLLVEIAPRFKDRPGGYTRIIKRHQRRLGDGGKTAFLELLKEGETKVKPQAQAPAPKVEEETDEETEENQQPPEEHLQEKEAQDQPRASASGEQSAEGESPSAEEGKEGKQKT